MNIYPVDVDVTVTIPFKDLSGAVVTPTGLAYNLYDGNDERIVGPVALPAPGPEEESVEVTIDRQYNAEEGVRTVELVMTTAKGNVLAEVVYAVQHLVRLVPLENSFQTYSQSQLTAFEMVNVNPFLLASKNDQVAALIEAFTRLTKLTYVIRYGDEIGDSSRILISEPHRITPDMWEVMDLDLFNEYPQMFIKALQKAQVCEANILLKGDRIGERRRAGLLSESIGESSMMFKTGVRPLDLSVSRETYNYLTGFVEVGRIGIGRA